MSNPDAGAVTASLRFSSFEIRLRPHRETIHVQPVGELDIATAPRLAREVLALTEAGFAHVVIDLRGLVFIDCAGVRLLVDLDERAAPGGWRLSLVQGPRVVRRLFELSETLDRLSFVAPDGL
ncbi:MAG: hypothetical protein QOF77_2215 [Solirubrobacteraceae bacterium]|jgi:anti-anti-sigma factor|nr:hypothetical protein [Solirubrobacteraceae bacterium]